jgi:hypothetical protein
VSAVNVWALRKEPGLKRALLVLEERLSGLVICDDDSDNPKAVRLLPEEEDGFSIYLYTFGQNEGHFGIQLEYPLRPGMARTVESREELELEELINLLKNHFPPATPA